MPWRCRVQDFRELIAWQLSDELKCEVYDFTQKGPASRDYKYRDQIRDSSASAPRNIAEGFGRFRPAEFARFLAFAVGSIDETKSSLIDGRDRGYLDKRLFSRLFNLACAARRATRNLLLEKRRQAREDRERDDDDRN